MTWRHICNKMVCIDGASVGNNMFTLLLYAHDAVIMLETPEGLQQLLNNLHEYSIKWKLTVNKEKTKVMVFRKGGNLPRNILFLMTMS